MSLINSQLNLGIIFAGTFLAGIWLINFVIQRVNQTEDGEEDEGGQGHPAGIYNEGNTCFVNSLLQALASIESFSHDIEAARRRRSKHDITEELMQELLNVLDKINNNRESINVTVLLDYICQVKQDLINLEQQDAHELYSAIVGCFDMMLAKRKSINLSDSADSMQEADLELRNSLIGYTKSGIICTQCMTETTIKIHPFYDLSLEIQSMGIVSIEDALRNYQKQEFIENWICSQCSVFQHRRKITARLKDLAHQNPDVGRIAQDFGRYCSRIQSNDNQLAQINQQYSQYVGQLCSNINDPVLSEYLQEYIQPIHRTIVKKTTITRYPKVLVLHMKRLVIDLMTGEPRLITKPIDIQETLVIKTRSQVKKYQLASMLTHVGNEFRGHYFAFRKLQDWFMISDSQTCRVPFSAVRRHQPYMLFYQHYQDAPLRQNAYLSV